MMDCAPLGDVSPEDMFAMEPEFELPTTKHPQNDKRGLSNCCSCIGAAVCSALPDTDAPEVQIESLRRLHHRPFPP